MNIKKCVASIMSCLILVRTLNYSFMGSGQHFTVWDIHASGALDDWDGTYDTSWYDENKTTFYIETAEMLAGLRKLVNSENKSFKGKTVYLEKDIDLVEKTWLAIGAPSYPYSQNSTYTVFEGTFNGNSHSISNIKCSTSLYAGLFGHSKGNIYNLTITNCDIQTKNNTVIKSSGAYAGGVCGYSEGVIKNCSVSGKVMSTAVNTDISNNIHPYAGGVCGYSKSLIDGCSNEADVSISGLDRDIYVEAYAGGVCGYSRYMITNCTNTGSISAAAIYNDYSELCSGGICGMISGRINNCLNSGNVTTSSTRSATTLYSGGIAGRTIQGDWWTSSDEEDQCVSKCSNSGIITTRCGSSNSFAGGISGLTGGAFSCSNFGDVTTEKYYGSSTFVPLGKAGGINGQGTAVSCYNWGNITGESASAMDPYSSKSRSDCYNAGIVSGTHEPSIDKMRSNKEFADSLGSNYTYMEGDLPALKWEIGSNSLRPNKFFIPPEDEYPDAEAIRISSREDLMEFAKRVNEGEYALNAYLSEDIVLRSTDAIQIGTLKYSGIFDGNGKTISGLNTNPDLKLQGLFGCIFHDATVKNLCVDCNITAQNDSGAICSINYGKIYNCTSKGMINTASTCFCVGGICGKNYGVIENCVYSGTIRISENGCLSVGGICGSCESVDYNNNKKACINNSSSLGEISTFLNYADNIGGICGELRMGDISCCFNSGKISVGENTSKVGGICGKTGTGIISDCYNTARVFAGKYVAGICGYSDGSTIITYCYNVGSIRTLGNDSFAGGGICSNLSSKKSYYLSGTINDNSALPMTSAQFSTGYVCALLNDNRSPSVWFQLETDPYPVLDSSHFDSSVITTTMVSSTTTTTTTNTMTTTAAETSSTKINSEVFSYIIIDDYVEITGIDKTIVSAVVPDKLNGLPVKSIKSSAFSDSTKLESIIISDSVSEIGIYAFSGCTSLKSIKLPDSLTKIKQSTFNKCTKLKSITIPDSVTEIEGAAFFGCKSLEFINIPSSVTKINNSTFNGCSNLSVVLPETIAEVGEYAFYCKSVAFMNPKCILPNSVYTVPGDVVIYGYKNSTAEAYAKKYNREFIAYDTSMDTPGDINCDGTVSIADAVSLQNFLLGRTKTLGNWKNADLCKDNHLDAFDMVLMRRLLIEKMN